MRKSGQCPPPLRFKPRKVGLAGPWTGSRAGSIIATPRRLPMARPEGGFGPGVARWSRRNIRRIGTVGGDRATAVKLLAVPPSITEPQRFDRRLDRSEPTPTAGLPGRVHAQEVTLPGRTPRRRHPCMGFLLPAGTSLIPLSRMQAEGSNPGKRSRPLRSLVGLGPIVPT